jgi:hypothetical protein
MIEMHRSEHSTCLTIPQAIPHRSCHHRHATTTHATTVTCLTDSKETSQPCYVNILTMIWHHCFERCSHRETQGGTHALFLTTICCKRQLGERAMAVIWEYELGHLTPLAAGTRPTRWLHGTRDSRCRLVGSASDSGPMVIFTVCRHCFLIFLQSRSPSPSPILSPSEVPNEGFLLLCNTSALLAHVCSHFFCCLWNIYLFRVICICVSWVQF